MFNLHNREGGSANDIQQTYNVNVGSADAEGEWAVRVRDRARRDTGSLNGWVLQF